MEAKVIETWGAKTPNGREKKWTLRLGKAGRGKEIASVTYWPWSSASIEQAERTIRAVARQHEVEVIW